jgi:hypothetical protein
VVTPADDYVTRRELLASLGMIASNTPTALAQATFPSFTAHWKASRLIHVRGRHHGLYATAPADLIFGCITATSIACGGHGRRVRGAGQNPPLGGGAVMDPWPMTEPDTRDITALGYEYI